MLVGSSWCWRLIILSAPPLASFLLLRLLIQDDHLVDCSCLFLLVDRLVVELQPSLSLSCPQLWPPLRGRLSSEQKRRDAPQSCPQAPPRRRILSHHFLFSCSIARVSCSIDTRHHFCCCFFGRAVATHQRWHRHDGIGQSHRCQSHRHGHNGVALRVAAFLLLTRPRAWRVCGVAIGAVASGGWWMRCGFSCCAAASVVVIKGAMASCCGCALWSRADPREQALAPLVQVPPLKQAELTCDHIFPAAFPLKTNHLSLSLSLSFSGV